MWWFFEINSNLAEYSLVQVVVAGPLSIDTHFKKKIDTHGEF
jgi:hypothetical protein